MNQIDGDRLLELIESEMQKIVTLHNQSEDSEERGTYIYTYSALQKLQNEIKSGSYDIKLIGSVNYHREVKEDTP